MYGLIKSNVKPESMKIKLLVFLFCILFLKSYGQSTDEKEFSRAVTISEIVQKEQRFVSKLNNLNEIVYPVGLISEGKDIGYAILLSTDEVNASGALLSAYMLFVIPQSGDTLGFAANKIPITNDGGFAGDIKLTLIKSHTFSLGNNISITIKGGENGSYVLMGCEGFKRMAISADVELSSEIFVQENPQTGVQTGNKVTTSFSVEVEDWHNMLVTISLPPFQLKSLPGFGFEAQSLTLDLSDYINPTGLNLPKAYQGYFSSNNLNLWQGLFIKDFILRFPPEFSKKSGNKGRTSIYASNLFIDDLGLSGFIGIDRLLDLQEGNMNGWDFSVERFEMALELNSLTGASFKGKLKIPMLDSALNYTACIGVDGNYLFSVTTRSRQSFNLWAADMTLDPNSTVVIEVKNGNFLPHARLNGTLTISASLNDNQKSNNSESNLSLAQIKFEGLELQTVSPYIKSGLFSLGSEKAQQKMANFPLQIDNLMVSFNENEAILGVDLRVNILGQNEGGIGAGGNIKIKSEHITANNSDYWKFAGVEIGMMSIHATISTFSFEGNLLFFKNDPIYGKGFQGNLTTSLKIGSDGITLNANAIFGKVNNLKYWFFDVLAVLNPGAPILPGVSIYGIGGGAFYHMKQNVLTFKPSLPGQNNNKNNSGIILGTTSSGINYIPTDSVFLGMKATVFIGTDPSNKVFNGDVTLEIAFNNRFGVKYIAFNGYGYFITPEVNIGNDNIKSNALAVAGGKTLPADNNVRGSVKASVNIMYDLSNNCLYGNLKVYVNVAGLITGVNEGNLAGEAEMYFSTNDWYIYIGKPNSPVGLKMMGILQSRSYFMMGTRILESPPPPSEVTAILKNPRYSTYMDELNNIKDCSGIAFGSRLQMSTGDISFMIFYGNLNAGVGFDLALKNYGNTHCAGSSSLIGINGWYANGQAYAYLQGTIGVRVKIFTIEKKVSIAEGGMAAILQGQMPNPIFLQGAVGGYFNVLDGLVKGSFNFEFTLGEKCEIQGGNPLNNVNVIAKVTPDDKSTDVNTFTTPQVVFNYPINNEFQMVDINNVKHTYRIRLSEFSIYESGRKIDAQSKWSNDYKTVVLTPTDLLPGEKNLKLKVSVVFEELKNNTWNLVYEDGKLLSENVETSFTTGKAPDYIDQRSVEYSYPLINQLNYYKNISSNGYIKLYQGYDYLFENSSAFVYKGIFTDVSSQRKLECNISYNYNANEITFTIPGQLANEKIIKFEIVKRPTNASSSIDENVVKETKKVEDLANADVELTTRNASGSIKQSKDKVIYQMFFRTSKYNSLQAKFQELHNKRCYFIGIRVNVAYLYSRFDIAEGFDKYEYLGNENIQPLIQFEANLDNNAWYNDAVYPICYQDYPITPRLTFSNTKYGVPPKKAVFLSQTNIDILLDQTSINNGVFDFSMAGYKGVIYDLANYIEYNYWDLLNKIVNYYFGNFTEPMKRVLSGKFVFYYKDYYPVRVKYILPGKNQVASEFQINIYNPF